MLQLVIDGLWGTESAKIFTIAVVILFLFSCLMLLFPQKRSWVINKAPSLLTTLGLFGTFCGVAIGLGEFDAANIDQSVMKLLDGMKLAFWTSILGMLGAFIIHLSQYIIGCFTVRKINVGKTTGDKIYEQLLRMNDMIDRSKDDNSIINEIQKLREHVAILNIDITKEIHVQQTTLDNFALKLVDYNTGALVEALNKVVRNFNTVINEQCGESFKQLNQAIDNLTTWQKNYRYELEIMYKEFHNASQGIDKIRMNLDAIPMIMTQLKDIIIALDDEMKQSSETLKSLIALRNNASDVFPCIQQGINDLTEELASNIKRTVAQIESSSKSQNDILLELRDKTFEVTVNLQTALTRGADQVQSVFNEAVRKMQENTLNSFDAFDKQTQESLGRVIQFMGDNLASIHQKLVDDCKELLEEIHSLAKEAHVNHE